MPATHFRRLQALVFKASNSRMFIRSKSIPPTHPDALTLKSDNSNVSIESA